MLYSLRGIKHVPDTPFLKEAAISLGYNTGEWDARALLKVENWPKGSMRRKHGKEDTISTLRHQRNSIKVIKCEKGFENKEDFIRQRLQMGIP